VLVAQGKPEEVIIHQPQAGQTQYLIPLQPPEEEEVAVTGVMVPLAGLVVELQVMVVQAQEPVALELQDRDMLVETFPQPQPVVAVVALVLLAQTALLVLHKEPLVGWEFLHLYRGLLLLVLEVEAVLVVQEVLDRLVAVTVV
jgi:hypothetical protein